MKNEKRNGPDKKPVSDNILNKQRYRKRKRKKNAAARFIESAYRNLMKRLGKGGAKHNNGRDEIVRVIRDENGVPVRVIRKRHIPVSAETRKKQVIGIVASLVLLWLIFFQVRFRPLLVTEIGGEKLRGRLDKVVVMDGIESRYLETGKKYDIDIKEIYTDIFGKKGQVSIKNDGVKIAAKDSSLASGLVVDKNSFTIKNSITSQTAFDIVVSYEDVTQEYYYIVKDNLSKKKDSDGYITNPNEYDAVVNKQRRVRKSYVPKDLVEPKVKFAQADRSVRKMRKVPAAALEELFAAAKKNGHELYAVSGFRTYGMQEHIHQNNVNQYGSEDVALLYSARAGESEHQLGTTMDVSTKEMGYTLSQSFGRTSSGRWLKKNCHKYGFIIRYPKGKEKITGYGYEPWHIRYVGGDLAQYLYRKNLTLEEYFEK